MIFNSINRPHFSPDQSKGFTKSSLKKEAAEKVSKIIDDFASRSAVKEHFSLASHDFTKLINQLKNHPDNSLLVDELQKIENKYDKSQAFDHCGRISLVYSPAEYAHRHVLPVILDSKSASQNPPLELQLALLSDNRPEGAIDRLASDFTDLFSQAAQANPRVAKLLNETIEKL